ncbi:LamG domain-containing protein [Aliirhizobium terrae]|uniref:LamG domain-containing protein n=1 Tax=Terrirhizobium terrae TaxID=2926709 RepID=UPI003369C9B2
MAENSALTWSAWIRPANLQRNSAIYSRREGRNALVIGLDDGSPFVEVTVNGASQRTTNGAPVAPGGWHHLAMVATPGLVTLYLDGAAYSTLNTSLPALNAVAFLGGDTAPAAQPAPPAPVAPAPDAGVATTPGAEGTSASDPAGSAVTPPAAAPPVAAPVQAVSARPGFVGEIDEHSISKIARSAGFVRMAAVSQGLEASKLIAFSVDEETASWLSGHFGVLIRAVTLDGWVVIGILMIMALASWVVMVEKHGYLKKQKRANDAFLPAFRALDRDLTELADAGTAAEEGVDAARRTRRKAESADTRRIIASIRSAPRKFAAAFPMMRRAGRMCSTPRRLRRSAQLSMPDWSANSRRSTV